MSPVLGKLHAELNALRHLISTGRYTRTQYERFVALARILNQAVL